MTIALDTEIVETRYDPKTRTCFYTIERGGKRWTAAIHADKLHAQKQKQLRRNYLANALEVAMRGPPDPPTGTKDNPFKPATWEDFGSVPEGSWFVNPADGKLHYVYVGDVKKP